MQRFVVCSTLRRKFIIRKTQTITSSNVGHNPFKLRHGNVLSYVSGSQNSHQSITMSFRMHQERQDGDLGLGLIKLVNHFVITLLNDNQELLGILCITCYRRINSNLLSFCLCTSLFIGLFRRRRRGSKDPTTTGNTTSTSNISDTRSTHWRTVKLLPSNIHSIITPRNSLRIIHWRGNERCS